MDFFIVIGSFKAKKAMIITNKGVDVAIIEESIGDVWDKPII